MAVGPAPVHRNARLLSHPWGAGSKTRGAFAFSSCSLFSLFIHGPPNPENGAGYVHTLSVNLLWKCPYRHAERKVCVFIDPIKLLEQAITDTVVELRDR